MNSTTYAKRSQHKPIDIMFRGAVDAKSKVKKVLFVDAVEVLNDRYLGRMYASNYFAIAENTVRINELNLIAVEELKNYHLAMKENFHIPDKTVYCIPVTTRFLDNDEDFALLLGALKRGGYKKGSVILSFFGVSLSQLDDGARKRYIRLRRGGYKTASAQFGEDYNSLDAFTGVTFDYLRCEASYFDATPGKKKLLTMLIRFCNSNKIALVMDGVNNAAQYTRFKKAGVKIVTGDAVSKLSQYVTNEFLGLTEPEGDKKTAYMTKLKKELDDKERAELNELEAMRKAALEAIRTGETDGIMPLNPRPELEKSPYQVRLEKQRELARECAAARMQALEERAEESGDDAEELLYNEQQELEKYGRIPDSKGGAALVFNEPDEDIEEIEQEPQNAKPAKLDANGNPYVTKRESGVSTPERPENDEKKTVSADLNAEAKLINEFRNEGMQLGLEGGMSGFGVRMQINDEVDKQAPPLVGSYNEKYQWVDADGNVFDGYFDADDKWVEYEKLDIATEGHYNEYGQWVDGDGRTYDGYFDEDGKWIDYTYADKNGEPVDNGYFDTKLGKWIAFGYFDARGAYHRIG